MPEIEAALPSGKPEERRNTTMMNNYEVPEVLEVGRAQDVILGSSKLVPIFDDSPDQSFRETEMAEDE
jgi:hypothetical protein